MCVCVCVCELFIYRCIYHSTLTQCKLILYLYLFYLLHNLFLHLSFFSISFCLCMHMHITPYIHVLVAGLPVVFIAVFYCTFFLIVFFSTIAHEIMLEKGLLSMPNFLSVFLLISTPRCQHVLIHFRFLPDGALIIWLL